MNLAFREVAFDSGERLACVALRREILRKPLGLDYSAEELARESDAVILACFEGGGFENDGSEGTGSAGERVVACCLLVAVPDEAVGRAVVFASPTAVKPRTMKMRQVAVAADCQGGGTGRRLMQYAEEWMLRHGVQRVVLHARETAVTFYRALGYAIEGEAFQEVGLVHRKMSKSLQPGAL